MVSGGRQGRLLLLKSVTFGKGRSLCWRFRSSVFVPHIRVTLQRLSLRHDAVNFDLPALVAETRR